MDKVRQMMARSRKSKTFLVLIIITGTFFAFVENDLMMTQRNLKKIMQIAKEVEVNNVSGRNNISSTSRNVEDYQMKSLATANGSAYCSYKAQEDDKSFHRLKDFFRDETEWKDEGAFNIFLIETSCSSWPNYRTWCSVESMAQQNPEGIVWYVMTSPEVSLRDGTVKGLLRKYKNLRIVTVDLRVVFRGTPIYDLYQSGAWYEDTEWPAANLSNMIRLAMVWHTGGFYSDTDVICIAPLTKLKNVIGLASFNLVNGADFHFTKRHPMLKHFMTYLNVNFNPYVWGMNGPQTVSAVLRQVCNEDILFSGLECLETKVLPHTAFNPIQPHMRSLLFKTSAETNMNKMDENLFESSI